MPVDERLKQIAIAQGGSEWTVLPEAVLDVEFQENLLSGQERNILGTISGNPNTIPGYRDHLVNIVAKYVSWIIFKKTKTGVLKKQVEELSRQIDKSKEKLEVIETSAEFIGGATILVEYSKAFGTTAGNHQKNAEQQLRWYFISLLGFATTIALVFSVSIADFPFFKELLADDTKSLPLNTGFFAMKAAILVFVFQITQFFRKNYGAEKHLEEIYRHRSDVLQSLHAVYHALDNVDERNKILSAGALFAYERGETGYITTREGAGSGDELIPGLFSRLFK